MKYSLLQEFITITLGTLADQKFLFENYPFPLQNYSHAPYYVEVTQIVLVKKVASYFWGCTYFLIILHRFSLEIPLLTGRVQFLLLL